MDFVQAKCTPLPDKGGKRVNPEISLHSRQRQKGELVPQKGRAVRREKQS
jgi:hypothetical protein